MLDCLHALMVLTLVELCIDLHIDLHIDLQAARMYKDYSDQQCRGVASLC